LDFKLKRRQNKNIKEKKESLTGLLSTNLAHLAFNLRAAHFFPLRHARGRLTCGAFDVVAISSGAIVHCFSSPPLLRAANPTSPRRNNLAAPLAILRTTSRLDKGMAPLLSFLRLQLPLASTNPRLESTRNAAVWTSLCAVADDLRDSVGSVRRGACGGCDDLRIVAGVLRDVKLGHWLDCTSKEHRRADTSWCSLQTSVRARLYNSSSLAI
jgi:hypothetical protein